jgi:uncharacterized protein (DUF58 family)
MKVHNETLSFANKQSFWQKKINAWLTTRIPAATRQTLNTKNVFIFPTRFGFAYIVFIVVLFLLGTNYQNNLIMLLSYFLASLFISAMLQSFFNLAGLTIEGRKTVKGFAQERIYLPLTLLTDKPRYMLNFSFEQHSTVTIAEASPTNLSDSNQVLVPYDTIKRGVYYAGRVRVSSEYALGLFNCWSKLDFDCQFIVYPKPIALTLTAQQYGSEAQKYQGHALEQHGDDFYQLKNYQLGESLTQVAWKQLAKGQGMFTKSYQSMQGSETWLKLADMPGSDVEKKLAYLCYLAQQYYHNDQTFGLDLQSSIIKPDHNKKHLEKCLYALAIFPRSIDRSERP